jgi:hypothetical protein
MAAVCSGRAYRKGAALIRRGTRFAPSLLTEARMNRHEIAFAGGTCRIDVVEGDDIPRFTARIGLIEPVSRRVRPLVFESGERVEIHATSEALALSSAIAYLESRFGAPSELQHGFVETSDATEFGRPFVAER